MRTLTLCAIAAVSAVASGCSASGGTDDPYELDSPPPGASGSAGAVGGTPSMGGIPGTGGGVPGTGGAPATGGTTTGLGGSAPTGGTTAAGGAAPAPTCTATGAFDGPALRDCALPGACGRCMWEKACAMFDYRCAHDAGCVCMAECVGVGGVGAAQGCLGQCGLAAYPPGFAEWVKGASDMCWDEGCGTLSGPLPDPGTGTGGDVGAGTEADCGFDPNLRFDPCGPVLQLQSADGSICVRIDRRNDGPGNDLNTAYTLLDVRVGPLGQVCHTADLASLCWHASHHNYADWAHVSCGGRHYDINVAKNCGIENPSPSPTFRLHVFESAPPSAICAPTTDGDCPIGAPIDLVPVP